MNEKHEQEYSYELGPIRPPSEANSLLVRVTRNCPWNRCLFCAVYKGKRFSVRPTEHVLKDIELVKSRGAQPESVFLQDANSLVVPAGEIVKILNALREAFPKIKRITTYARSQTISRLSDENLRMLREAGLDRIHIGMESGSDKVLERIQKGIDQATHVLAGRKVKQAGFELSEYIMPGLGGYDLSEDHAIETAKALNQIDPDFIRVRTLALPKRCELSQEYREGRFARMDDTSIAREMKLFFENLGDINSQIVSDHIVNLLPAIEGRWPDAKGRILTVLDEYLAASPEDQMIYMIGRRLGAMSELRDIRESMRREYALEFIRKNQITPENAWQYTAAMSDRFV
ncbi:MAG TPA: radical SAM protein [Clostridiales bacterium]|nr:radical SAM protein [Clostridiales bacterium]